MSDPSPQPPPTRGGGEDSFYSPAPCGRGLGGGGASGTMFAGALRQAAEALANAGIEDPAREARLLLGHVLGLTGTSVVEPSTEIDSHRFEPLLTRRLAHEPMAFILGRQGF